MRDSAAPNSPGKPLTIRESGYVVNHPTFPNGVVLIRYSERGVPEDLNPAIEVDGKNILQGVRLESEPGKPVA